MLLNAIVIRTISYETSVRQSRSRAARAGYGRQAGWVADRLWATACWQDRLLDTGWKLMTASTVKLSKRSVICSFTKCFRTSARSLKRSLFQDLVGAVGNPHAANGAGFFA